MELIRVVAVGLADTKFLRHSFEKHALVRLEKPGLQLHGLFAHHARLLDKKA